MTERGILERMGEMKWTYGPSDPAAQASLEERIVESAMRKRQLHYSELVKGVLFVVEGSGNPRDHVIDEWSDFDRALIGAI